MYIKFIFKREQWSVPGCNAGFMDGLFSAPSIAEQLPKDVQADKYTSVRSQFAATPDIFHYYLDCGNMPRDKIALALKLFDAHYSYHRHGWPSTLVGVVPEENEIISNMKIALENVLLEPSLQKPYLHEFSMGTPSDVVRALGN